MLSWVAFFDGQGMGLDRWCCLLDGRESSNLFWQGYEGINSSIFVQAQVIVICRLHEHILLCLAQWFAKCWYLIDWIISVNSSGLLAYLLTIEFSLRYLTTFRNVISQLINQSWYLKEILTFCFCLRIIFRSAIGLCMNNLQRTTNTFPPIKHMHAQGMLIHGSIQGPYPTLPRRPLEPHPSHKHTFFYKNIYKFHSCRVFFWGGGIMVYVLIKATIEFLCFPK